VKLAEAGRDVALALLGVLIFGIFREIAMRARNFDLFRELVVKLVLEGGDFVLELFLNFFSKVFYFDREIEQPGWVLPCRNP